MITYNIIINSEGINLKKSTSTNFKIVIKMVNS